LLIFFAAKQIKVQQCSHRTSAARACRVPFMLRTAKGTPISRSAEDRRDRRIAAHLAGCGNPAYTQRHGRAAFPSCCEGNADLQIG